jgi:hypothetical protein
MGGMRWSETANYGVPGTAQPTHAEQLHRPGLRSGRPLGGEGKGSFYFSSFAIVEFHIRMIFYWMLVCAEPVLANHRGFRPCKRTDVKTQQESIWCLRFLRRWTQGWTGGDPQNCSLPNPATGKYGPNCTAWDAAKWSPGMQARRKPAPFSSFWK